MGEVKNYLDIQLRDMDYENNYPGNLRLKFLDLDHYYREDDVFEQKYNTALEKAKRSLDLKMSGTKVENDPVVKSLVLLYKQRLQREQRFIKEWEKEFGMNRKDAKTKVAFPLNGDYTLSTSRAYAYQFSNFLITAIGAQDNEIIKCLRSDELATAVSGLASKVFSSRAAEGHNSNKKGQSDINLYYENLFTTFFFGKRIRKDEYKVSLEEMTKKGSTVGSQTFKEKFNKFIQTYYGSRDSKFGEAIKRGLASLTDECAERIYQNFNASNPKYFTFTRSEGRGTSELTQQQLKKMLLQTIREIADANGANGNYDDYTIPGLIEVNAEWREMDGKYNAVVQTKIDDMKKKRSQLRADKRSGKHVDMRHYNRTYGVNEHEEDAYEGVDGDPVQLKELFLQFITNKIAELIKRPLSKQEEHTLSRAVFQKIDKTIKRGDKALNAMTAYGPTQMKGFLGEVATAYSLQLGSANTQSGIYTEVTGAERTSIAGQANFDVAARIGESTIGFQVKNYKGKSATLYTETVHLGRQEMYKYFSDNDVKAYRWLFANGLYLTSVNDIPDLRKKMEMSFFNSISNFLRITDASYEGMIESDVYVIGSYYFPSSYLIAAAIDRVKKELEKNDGNDQTMFKLYGSFPGYREKAKPKEKMINRNGVMVNKTFYGNKRMPDKNIMYIDKSRVLDNGEIKFKGITINFSI